jgi:hypothetical protein
MKSQRKALADSSHVALVLATGIAIALLALSIAGLLLRHAQASFSLLGGSEIALLVSGTVGSSAALWMMRRQR